MDNNDLRLAALQHAASSNVNLQTGQRRDATTIVNDAKTYLEFLRGDELASAETTPRAVDTPDGDGNVFGGESYADRIAEGHVAFDITDFIWNAAIDAVLDLRPAGDVVDLNVAARAIAGLKR